MKDKDCIFCKIVAGEIPSVKIYENDVVYSFLDIGPLSEGHTLVIPKEHYSKLHECPADLFGTVASTIPKIASAVIEALGYEDYNVLCNNGRSAGQLVDHVHFHIIPRRQSDNLFNRWPSSQYPEGKIETVSQKIREKL
jgi:histidine triad (HIT) family protein